jgi:hypothetical protein
MKEKGAGSRKTAFRLYGPIPVRCVHSIFATVCQAPFARRHSHATVGVSCIAFTSRAPQNGQRSRQVGSPDSVSSVIDSSHSAGGAGTTSNTILQSHNRIGRMASTWLLPSLLDNPSRLSQPFIRPDAALRGPKLEQLFRLILSVGPVRSQHEARRIGESVSATDADFDEIRPINVELEGHASFDYSGSPDAFILSSPAYSRSCIPSGKGRLRRNS